MIFSLSAHIGTHNGFPLPSKHFTSAVLPQFKLHNIGGMPSPLGSSQAVALQSCNTHFPCQRLATTHPITYLPSTHPSYESTLATSLDNPKRSLVAHSNQKANTSPGTPWNPMELKFRGIQLDSLEFDRFPCNSMEFHEIAEASLTSNGIHCNPMHPYGVPWKP